MFLWTLLNVSVDCIYTEIIEAPAAMLSYRS